MNYFQSAIRYWLIQCFGQKSLENKKERSFRFLEESLELVQSCDLSKEDALKIIDYVYSRPSGERRREIGGVFITLYALGIVWDHDIEACGELELQRCWRDIDKIRDKQMNKELKG